MSKIVNDDGSKPGSIYRLALENFVTYKQVELYPGPSLNLIIGPNGTGKSTFVCAIILGLCGKTSVIGRAKKISEYVRSGCKQASIEIELYREAGQRNVIITRSFNLESASTWCIDHKSVREKQVQELIAGLNIQVDNLCQLLPQDRVQDFSKMDPQQLLRSTLAAVGGQESVSQLDELIESRTQQRNIGAKLVNNTQVLEEQIRLNEGLKVTIDAMQQRKEIEKEIDICEKKKLWLEYQELREKVIEYANDEKEAVKLVTSHRKKVDPLEKLMQKATNSISKLEQQKLASTRDVHKLRDKVKEIQESIKTQVHRLTEIDTTYQEKLERHRNREREIDEAKAKLDKLVTDRSKLVETVGDESKVKMELAEVHKPIQKTTGAIETLKKQKLQIQYDLENNVMPQIEMYKRNVRKITNVEAKRLELLEQCSRDAYNAYTWLQDNRDQFQMRVCSPMLVEINFTDPKFARYLESTVANRDLLAFTFECTRDMNLFLRTCRTQLGLKRVNAVCSPPGNDNFEPPQSIDDISYLGFYTYVRDTISAPDAITRYLCRQYNIHRIPIGDEHTYNNSGRVPNNISFFFTENHRFTVRHSAYSGAKSSSTIEIRPAKLLANSVDMERLNTCNAHLSKFEETAESHQSKMDDFDRKLSVLEQNLDVLNTRRKKINEGVEKVRTISAQIRLQQRKVHDIESEPALDMAQELDKCSRQRADCVAKQCRLHSELSAAVRQLQTCLLNGQVFKVHLELSRQAIVQQESELRELKNELRNVEATLENVKNALNRAKSTAKHKLTEAKQSCNNKLPQDPTFPYTAQFNNLPSDMNALQEHCCELQTRIECMGEHDQQVIKEYEEREKLIHKLKSEVNNSTDVNKVLEEKMTKLKESWLPPLEALLRSINTTFGDMFAKLDCAGEVKLDKTGSDEDYDKYGIGILVRFRSSEQLQQLTRHAQSGGERALTTALYLMALQRRATVPFRCVDEINQGMDPVNERKMFQLLVRVTTQCDNAQYFLLTPKLLTKLDYNPKIMVHTIQNGKTIMNYKKWKLNEFIQRAREYRP